MPDAFATVTAVDVVGELLIATVADVYAVLLEDARATGVALVSP